VNKNLTLNTPQALVHLINANKTYLLWGRGSGKSSGALGPRTIHLANVMPRAQIGIICPSYIMAKQNILPNIIGYWKNNMGLKEGVDFVVFKKPPLNFREPIYPVYEYDHVITFKNGTSFCVISLAITGSANGFNLQALIGDEAKFFDEKRLREEVFPVLRGCYKEFGHLPEYRSEFYCTDKLGKNIRWLLNKKILHYQKLIDIVLSVQLTINELNIKFTETKSEYARAKALKLQAEVDAIKRNLVYVSESTAYDNAHNLTPKFFIDMKNELSEYQYAIAIGNKDPNYVEDCFYPSLSTSVLYFDNTDVKEDKPFIVAFDYQFRISPMVVAQVYSRLDRQSINVVDSLFELYPNGIPEVIKAFSLKYKNKRNRIIYYIYDHTAVERKSGVKRHSEVVREELLKYNWVVIDKYIGQAPDHHAKYQSIDNALKQKRDYGLYINQFTNKYLLLSMQQSKAIIVSGKTAKDKSSEKDLNFPPQESTHLSDTFDTIIAGILDYKVVPLFEQNSSIEFK
jgi:hypothetical protein